MPILSLGINHQTAPVDIREKVTFAPEQLPVALQQLFRLPDVKEGVILSTCNRTEIYCDIAKNDLVTVQQWFSSFHGLNHQDISPYFYQHTDQQASNHLFRVASGLDSMVLGESQILGQLKDAFELARSNKTVKSVLGRLFQHSFSVAKKVRTDTQIGANPVSVAFAAVSLSKQIFGDLQPLQALMIGAGETIELAARHLRSQNIGKIVIANRTIERAEQLAKEVSATAVKISDIPQQLIKADIVISSTASQLPILGKGATETALKHRKHRPIFMVDLAVPRDIEPQVGELDDIYLYTVDDLKEVIDENLRSRELAAEQAQEIIEVEVRTFEHWLSTHSSADEIRNMRNKAEAIKTFCLEKAQSELLKGEDAEKVLQTLANNLTNKLLHGPTIEMRKALKENKTDNIALIQSLIQSIDS